MNVAHAVIPLEEYDKMKQLNDNTTILNKRMTDAAMFNSKLHDALIDVMFNPHDHRRDVHTILRQHGLVLVESHGGNKEIELIEE